MLDTDLAGRPNGDPLDLILHRLDSIERRMDHLMTEEVYVAQDEAIRRRLESLEASKDEARRAVRQIIAGTIATVLGAAVVAGIAVF